MDTHRPLSTKVSLVVVIISSFAAGVMGSAAIEGILRGNKLAFLHIAITVMMLGAGLMHARNVWARAAAMDERQAGS